VIARVRDAARAIEDPGPTAAVGFASLLAPVAELLHLDVAAAFQLAVVDDRTRLDAGHSIGADMIDAFDRFLGGAPRKFGGYDPLQTERAERNRVFRRDELAHHESSPLVRDFYPRFGLARLPQLRVLVCDGAAMLGWVGGWRAGEFSDDERRALQSLVAPLRRRLRVLSWSGKQGLHDATLQTVMNAIGAPAFLVRIDGTPALENAGGRARMAAERRATLEQLARAVRGAGARGDAGGVRERAHVSPVRTPGAPLHYLVVLPAVDDDVATRAVAIARRWSLTPRQGEVLLLLVRGAANKTIAATLGCSVRTIEVHVTALLEKSQCDSRAELGAKFWQSR
jgi:DNA-binding CsgD family transcriptional regulator